MSADVTMSCGGITLTRPDLGTAVVVDVRLGWSYSGGDTVTVTFAHAEQTMPWLLPIRFLADGLLFPTEFGDAFLAPDLTNPALVELVLDTDFRVGMRLPVFFVESFLREVETVERTGIERGLIR